MYHNLKPEREHRPRRKTPAEKRPGKDPKHLENVRKLPCCVCGYPTNIDAHHMKATGERGMGLKSSDKWAVPLCRAHHDALERRGSRNEVKWFEDLGIAPLTLAAALWASRHDLERMKNIVETHRG